MLIYKIMISLILAFISLQAFAFPLPGNSQRPTVLPSGFTRDYNFEGIVALSNCSGSLIRFETSGPDDLAVVLSNGHCFEQGFIPAGQSVVDQPSSRQFNLMSADGGHAGSVRATRLIYGTMTKTDITLYRLNKTYAQILSQTGVHPLTLASQPSKPGQAIEVISGYWERGYSCQIEAVIPHVQEEDWTWTDSIRYSRPGCEVIGGTSGSPVIATGTRTVIGVNNTGNMDGDRCTRDNPCEIDSQGHVTYTQGYSYGEQTYWIYSCLESNNQFNPKKPGCLLP